MKVIGMLVLVMLVAGILPTTVCYGGEYFYAMTSVEPGAVLVSPSVQRHDTGEKGALGIRALRKQIAEIDQQIDMARGITIEFELCQHKSLALTAQEFVARCNLAHLWSTRQHLIAKCQEQRDRRAHPSALAGRAGAAITADES